MRPLTSPTQESLQDPPLAAWFLGPKAEQSQVWEELLGRVFDDYIHWRRNYFPQDPIVISRERQHTHERWFDALTTLLVQQGVFCVPHPS
ncbi:MAG: Pyridoxal-dependent decarboxylase [Gemmatimonadetes bacterium]|nr:Pyridoxal-dependent decarboxylase [Gemmatimonadota bacterium]